MAPDLGLLFRLAVVLIVTPTLMFLGLVRLLESLRDDDLLNRLMTDEERHQLGTNGALTEFVGDATGRTGPVQCSDCGAPNPRGMYSCVECGARLD